LIFRDVGEVSFPITDNFKKLSRGRAREFNAFIHLTILETSAAGKIN
jgi:hypothetical protein